MEEVEYFAELARLDLQTEEKECYQKQLSGILRHFRSLQAVDTVDIPPMPSTISPVSVLREDDPKPGLTQDELFLNAPQKERFQFRLPPVFE